MTVWHYDSLKNLSNNKLLEQITSSSYHMAQKAYSEATHN